MIAMLDDTLETWVGVEMKSIYYWTHEIESPTNGGLIGRFLPPAKNLVTRRRTVTRVDSHKVNWSKPLPSVRQRGSRSSGHLQKLIEIVDELMRFLVLPNVLFLPTGKFLGEFRFPQTLSDFVGKWIPKIRHDKQKPG